MPSYYLQYPIRRQNCDNARKAVHFTEVPETQANNRTDLLMKLDKTNLYLHFRRPCGSYPLIEGYSACLPLGRFTDTHQLNSHKI